MDKLFCRTQKVPVNEPLLNGNEKKYLNECIDTGWISSEGPFVKRLEEGMAAYVGRKYASAVCNGTAALDLAVEALGLQPGDEVVMPAFTIISCVLCLVRRGIKPVLVDADANTWNMDVNQIESKITPKTRAIMVVHIYGLPVDMDAVMQIAGCGGGTRIGISGEKVRQFRRYQYHEFLSQQACDDGRRRHGSYGRCRAGGEMRFLQESLPQTGISVRP